jgi:hypothetical protein
MLQKLAEKIAQCHRRAREAKEKAERATDFAAKRDYLNLERRWLLLAESYELTQRVSDFNAEVKKRIAVLRPPDPPDPALPRVLCPSCGKRMRLISIEPVFGARRAERNVFECVCGFVLAQTQDRQD